MSVGETLVPVRATVRGTETAKVTLINSCIRYQGGNLVSVGETCSTRDSDSERDRNSEPYIVVYNPHK